MSVDKSLLSKLPQLQTQHLLLRKFSLDDAQDLFECTSDPEINRFMLFSLHQTIEDTKKFLASYESWPIAPWGIVDNASAKIIGQCGFVACDTRHFNGTLGYFLARSYWGKGYMTEAVQAALDFGFNTLRLNRIEAQIAPFNDGSRRVLEKVGMSYEGTLRQNVWVRGEFEDSLLYSILRSEWHA